MSYVKEKTITWAKSQVGFHEGPNNSNPYSVWQGLDNNNPWCASFQCQADYEGGYRFSDACTFGERGEAYTPTEAERAKVEGLWRDKNWRALPGDAVLYDWGNNGLIDHVEVVYYDDGNHLVTIGGNTSDSVAYRTRDRTYVAGFWALSQSDQAKPLLDAAAIAGIKRLLKWRTAVTIKALQFKDSGPNVTILNQLLANLGLLATTKYMNTYTKATRDAVVHFKRLRHLTNDVGVTFGGEAAAAILAPR